MAIFRSPKTFLFILSFGFFTLERTAALEFNGYTIEPYADLRGADLTGFDLQDIKSFSGLQISASQQHHLLRSLGIDVFADEA